MTSLTRPLWSGFLRQCVLNCFYRKEQFKFVGRKRYKAKFLIEFFGFLIFGIDKKPNTAGDLENLDELFHRRNQENFSDPLPFEFFGTGQPAKPDSRNIARQFFCLFRGKHFRFYLAKIQREKSNDRLWSGGILIH